MLEFIKGGRFVFINDDKTKEAIGRIDTDTKNVFIYPEFANQYLGLAFDEIKQIAEFIESNK